ncbi:uncharacterized protein LOC132601468 [Lycium barbarum]|uniref:uncharacterized protein LOC132601468 n=1 Tax=Lycium barbarum TaxID=112863 RepID=UPI00293ECCF3|nr:uncharacterized protein LOC132601468 [Lycium barbarum]
MEDVIKVKELQFELKPSSLNREALYKAQADLNRYLHLEKEYQKQKYGMRWFKDGDRNTKFFQNYVKGRRKKLEAVSFYQNQFRHEGTSDDYEMLQKIPKLITDGQNEELTALPSNEEVKLVVFGLNGGGLQISYTTIDRQSGTVATSPRTGMIIRDRTSGPVSGHFFQTCWHIISENVTNMVRDFFCGQELPRFITHTNLVLIPKKEVINTFTDMRSISLSTFANKIISRVLHERIIPLLPGIISNTQIGFVKGRSIVENVLLAQEITH